MTEEYKTLNNYMRYLANTLNYNSWSEKEIGYEFRERLNKAIEEFKKESINFSNLTDEEFKMLGFCDFDENNKNLIPLWLFRLLDDNVEVICFDGTNCLKKDADDDIRFGCTAYMLKAN